MNDSTLAAGDPGLPQLPARAAGRRAAAELVCTGRASCAYPVRDDIPVLLVDEARPARAEPATRARR